MLLTTPHAAMHCFPAKLMHPGGRMLALAALSLITLAAADPAATIPAPSDFRAVADGRWTPQYRLGWMYSDTIDYLYFEVARNCSDGRSVFIRVDDKAMTDYFDIKSLRCTYAVRAISSASTSDFSPSVTVGFGGLPSAPQSIVSVLPTKANTLQAQRPLRASSPPLPAHPPSHFARLSLTADSFSCTGAVHWCG